jgi:hypothetical protein
VVQRVVSHTWREEEEERNNEISDENDDNKDRKCVLKNLSAFKFKKPQKALHYFNQLKVRTRSASEYKKAVEVYCQFTK